MPRGSSSLNLIIGTAPAESFSLEHDLRLLKVALLYGDRALLCSPAASQLFEMAGLKQSFAVEQGNRIEEPDAKGLALVVVAALVLAYFSIGRDQRLHDLRHAEWLGRLPPEIIAAVERLTSDLSRLHQEIDRLIEDPELRAAIEEVSLAVRSGNVDVHSFGMARPEEAVQAFVTRVTEAVVDGESFPLLDAATGDLIGRALRDRQAPDPGPAHHAKHVHLAAHLFERLPAFEDATVAEILDLRRELDPHLVRFRAAMLGFADKIASAPWDRDFTRDAERVILHDVEPAILSIQEAVHDNRVVAHLRRHTFQQDWKLAASGTIAVGIAQWAHLPTVLIGGALGASLPLIRLVNGAMEARRQEHRSIERNGLFFYYRMRDEMRRR
ncbi:MAG: hypothetical protein ABW277_18670 [Longimicrobiaceae bacterium]